MMYGHDDSDAPEWTLDAVVRLLSRLSENGHWGRVTVVLQGGKIQHVRTEATYRTPQQLEQ